MAATQPSCFWESRSNASCGVEDGLPLAGCEMKSKADSVLAAAVQNTRRLKFNIESLTCLILLAVSLKSWASCFLKDSEDFFSTARKRQFRRPRLLAANECCIIGESACTFEVSILLNSNCAVAISASTFRNTAAKPLSIASESLLF